MRPRPPRGEGMRNGDEQNPFFLDEPTPSAKRQRKSNMGAGPELEMQASKTMASPASAKKPTTPSMDGKPELLFSRVALRAGGESGDTDPPLRKARVTAVEGDAVEVITEGSWSTEKVAVGDISVIE